MEEFYEKHPDFGLKGTFYVNLGNSTFEGAGTLQQRLQYLVDKGFENWEPYLYPYKSERYHKCSKNTGRDC